MLTIKPLRREDVRRARELSDAAGWNQLDPDWERLVELWPETTIAGWLDGTMIATASLPYFDPAPGTPAQLAWIGVMLVDKACRGAGYGGQMFDAVLKLGAERGIVDFGLDASDLGHPVYVKRGFVDRFGMNRWSCNTPKPLTHLTSIAAKIRPATDADWDAIFQMDAKATGVIRSTLLKRLAAEPSALRIVAEEGGKLRGFAMYRLGRLACYIGPVIATDVKVATGLANALLAAHGKPSFPMFIDVASDCPIEPFLRDAGFAIARRLVRMTKAAHPENLAWGPMAFAVSGMELC